MAAQAHPRAASFGGGRVHVLMGPENYTLDLFKNWRSRASHIVFLFDTLLPKCT